MGDIGMKKFEFLISESCATKFDISAETEEQAREIFLTKGLCLILNSIIQI